MTGQAKPVVPAAWHGGCCVICLASAGSLGGGVLANVTSAGPDARLCGGAAAAAAAAKCARRSGGAAMDGRPRPSILGFARLRWFTKLATAALSEGASALDWLPAGSKAANKAAATLCQSVQQHSAPLADWPPLQPVRAGSCMQQRAAQAGRLSHARRSCPPAQRTPRSANGRDLVLRWQSTCEENQRRHWALQAPAAATPHDGSSRRRRGGGTAVGAAGPV